MKKTLTIFGAFFIASLVLTSCGEVNLKDLDKGIEDEEDVVEALLILGEASMDVMESVESSLEEIADLKDRAKEIQEVAESLGEEVGEEDLDLKDVLEDREVEEMIEEIDEKMEDINKLMEDVWEVISLLE